ncbi:hypothetical protein [Microcoleus sp. Pol10D4]|uniref:hypothetical protein n=1 Tax=Microcoleus sp. Pol10D4 TaxID=3055387 RepID=UPI002FD04921
MRYNYERAFTLYWNNQKYSVFQVYEVSGHGNAHWCQLKPESPPSPPAPPLVRQGMNSLSNS